MRVQRYRRRSSLWWGLWVIPVCLAGGLIGVLLLPALPGLALRVVGFEPQGDVEAFWSRRASTETTVQLQVALPTAAVLPSPAEPALAAPLPRESDQVVAAAYEGWFQSYQTPATVVIDVGTLGSVSLSSGEILAETLWIGEGTDGRPLGIIVYREDALTPLCARWLQNCVTGQFRVSGVDFRAGGAVISGSIFLAGLWQEAGLVALVTPAGAGLIPAGVVVNGMLYAIPPDGEIADFVDAWVMRVNTALQQATVRAGGQTLSLASISMTEDRLTFILR